MRRPLLIVLFCISLVTMMLWSISNQPIGLTSAWNGNIRGVAYTPFATDQSPWTTDKPTPAQIEQDFLLLKDKVSRIRTYSLTDGSTAIPAIAARHGIKVTLGAWLSGNAELDQQQINTLIRLAKGTRTVERVLVGNEVLLRKEMTVDQVIARIHQVKAAVNVPVSTAEPWHVWLDNPNLARSVDFLAVHILPYWEGIPVEAAVDYTILRWRELKTQFPTKPVVITEVGWPSDGPWRKSAQASRVMQAEFTRQFLTRAAKEGLTDYFIMEAFDQPWKTNLEGSAGSAWGLWDSDRQPKFAFSGPVQEKPYWWGWCSLALVIATGLSILLLRWKSRTQTMGITFLVLLCHLTASILAWTLMNELHDGFTTSMSIAWTVLLLLQLALLVLFIAQGLEITDILWSRGQRINRLQSPHEPLMHAPKVSIHVPCYNEPPEMVMQTLNLLAQLDYPNFEVIVMDNNTKDEAVWQPLAECCDRLGERFRFFHEGKLAGFKAGALNYALEKTASDAEFIAVIDSDYHVVSNWLSSMMPLFARPEVGFLQSPQDYRDWQGDTFKTMIAWEYAEFFHIGMVRRDEDNAIIQHGTMTIIRKTALQELGGWATWCITEDAELGLRLMAKGYEGIYINHSFGKGLVPDSLSGYKSQRFRWVYGAVQILKCHWREFLTGRKNLNFDQKYHFLTGWMPWFADGAHLVLVILGIIWSFGMMMFPSYVEFPPAAFIVPTLGVFIFKMIASFWLYHACVPCGWGGKLGAAIAGMSLTHTIGRAVWQGLFTSNKPFFRTPKCENHPRLLQALMAAREEMALMIGLILMAVGILTVFTPQNRDAVLWATLLIVQSLPYGAAVIMAIFSTFPEIKFTPTITKIASENL